MSNILSKILILFLTIIGIIIIVGEIINIHIYFPLTISENEKIPYHRLQSVRLSLIISFIYFPFFFKADKIFCRLILLSLGIWPKINGKFPNNGPYIIT